MATKWKNKLIILAWLLLFTYGLSSIMTGVLHGSEYINKNYFQTNQFTSQLDQFIDQLSRFELDRVSLEEAKKLITVSQEEIEEHRYRYGDLPEQIANINGQYELKIHEAEQKEVRDAIISERDRKIEDITQNFKSDEHVRKKIIKEKEQKLEEYYHQIEQDRAEFVKSKSVFQYRLTNTETGQTFTNVTKDTEKIDLKDMLFIRQYPSPSSDYLRTDGMSDELNQLLSTRNGGIYEGQVAISKDSVLVKSVLPDYYQFEKRQRTFYILVISGLIAFLLSLYALKKMPVLSPLAPESWQLKYNRVPIDLAAAIFAFCGLITLFLLMKNYPLYLLEYSYELTLRVVKNTIITSLFVALLFSQGQFLIKRMSNKESLKVEWVNSLVYRANEMLKEAFLHRHIGTQVVLLLGIAFALGAGMIITLIQPVFILLYGPITLFIGIPVLVIMIKRAGYFNRIVMNTGELVQGKNVIDLPVVGKSLFATLAGHINALKQGVKSSQREQAKSERLKTELITNVSHDLRTPLTSIISYTELLKKQDLTEEERNSYVQIIDRKSKRLKVLIEDLFEASKMASGNIDLAPEKVDLVQLLQQALAEYNEQIQQSSLQFRVATPDFPVYAVVDGQKMWRVFENLIGNILKYALENTRVYISLIEDMDRIVITFKNVTKYELGDNIDEMFERFKRGDTSRHTEGSGLGLAIAKSIIDLHGGILDLEVDGDLFKATVQIKR
ncbi:sensor histidine kinase [Ammoniphilus resinae]|uniref:histidine kinase n=1 Tax=Ammoniphilus resinae TaxID=861532 RepID=A0ABS4GN98_9BACL|nr:MFS domain-containing histidine kinase [Ammoniphilus resinae]MBP1931738.1 signal transduction histidine kinase [Ammoniphilus resinae]